MRIPSGIARCLVVLFGTIGVACATTVVCEPQPGSGPNDEADPPGPYGYHTPNASPWLPAWDYWYEVTPSAGESINYFVLYTGLQYDSDLDFFLNCYQPEGWTNGFSSSIELGISVHWSNVTGNALSGSVTAVFGFDHRSDAAWGAWSSQDSGVEVDSSTNHSGETNGTGYLVHVPGTYAHLRAEVFVATNGAHVYPFTNWAMAARDISSAVALAVDGGTVHVSNGTYHVTNAIVVERNMTISSVNGRDATIVEAGGVLATTRCFFLACTNIVLRGFTIRGGASAGNGGGILLGSPSCTVDGCVIESNSALNGAGLYVAQMWDSRVQNCIIRNNNAGDSAGGIFSTYGMAVTNCLFINNFAAGSAGGLSILNGEVLGCEFRENTALADGGAIKVGEYVSVRNSLIVENTCSGSGGGIYFARPGEVVSCTVASNSAGVRGGGLFSTAPVPEGPPGCIYYSSGGQVRNTILYGNSAVDGPNYYHADFNWIYEHACAVPRRIGDGNIALNPQFAAGAYRLSSDSPCINAGTNTSWMAGAADAFGGARVVWEVVDIGADEFDSEPLACGFDAARPSGVSPLTNAFTARVQGANVAGLFYRWDFNGDLVDDLAGYGLAVVTNVFSGYTNFSVQLTVTNAAGEIAVSRKDNCVRTGPVAAYVSTSGVSLYPYENWGASATTIQDAVNAAVDGTVVFVSNGVYAATNEIRVADGVSLVSMGGAAVTIVDGRGSNRCFYLNHERAVVDGFTLRNGGAAATNFPGGSGGGAFVECGGTICNCIVASNTSSGAHVSGYGGGGIYCWQGGLVENCLLQGNASAHDGGGVECWHGGMVRNCRIECNSAAVGGGGALCEGDSLLESCTIAYNSATWFGGGTYSWYGGEIRNCIISSNVAPYYEFGDWSDETILRNAVIHEPQKNNHGYFSSFPEGDPENPFDGRGNLVADPCFRSAAARDYRLATNSPCIDAGSNSTWMAGALDLEGKPRIIGSKVDIGAYESIPMGLDSDGDGMPDWWEWDWARTLTNMAASADDDHDEFENLSEYQAGTRPLDGDSFLGMLMPTAQFTGAGLLVQWQSASNRNYRLERSTNLIAGFTDMLAGSIPATPPMNVYTDATAVLNGPYVYRILTSP